MMWECAWLGAKLNSIGVGAHKTYLPRMDNPIVRPTRSGAEHDINAREESCLG
jgi:hypothetical protein